MKREILESPFDNNLIRSRRGPSGRSFSYVEGQEYIRRLNDAFDGEWSFDIVEYKIMEKDVIVVGRLEAEGLVKVAFGGSSITTSYQTGEALNLADDLKAAATDALKKASSLFGLGLHLYSKDIRPPSPQSNSYSNPPQKNSPPEKSPPQKSNGKSQNPPNSHPVENQKSSSEKGSKPQKSQPTPQKTAPRKNALTDRQLKAINAISRSLGWTSEVLRQHSLDNFEVPPEELSKSDASQFIGELQKMVTQSAA